MGRLWIVLTLALALACGGVFAKEAMQLKQDHPKTYTVKKGDTLWDISKKFLKTPWLWPRLWQVNRQVSNPHLIYPGDVLSLIWINGEPRLVKKRVVRLSPKVRVEEKVQPIPTLPLSEIGPFLRLDHIFNGDDINSLPFVLGNNETHLGMQTGEEVFVRGVLQEDALYGIYRPGKVYEDVETGESLGQQAIFVGIYQAGKVHDNQLTSGIIRKQHRAVMQGDKLMLLPEQDSQSAYFTPMAGDPVKGAYVVDIANQQTQVGKLGVLVLNKGMRDKLKPGDVYMIERPGIEVAVTGRSKPEANYSSLAGSFSNLFATDTETLPSEQVGRVMVFRVYDKMSIALVLDSIDPIRKEYLVHSIEVQ
ncbi:LysM peptidoglycan-binding domain-containing protein [Dongshaea marina]|uniref:LysM peptidoglycan-binding domain-containing protein n=1 Tax=Dongshaea marina TaxID=2047966 RepID=UPI001900FCBE|nr:LysM peptidoglycan-binding domain-containing protein [Dongshaea marina]